VLIFEPSPGAEPRVHAVLHASRRRAEQAGWHCWAYRNQIQPSELMLFIEGPEPGPGGPAAPALGDEISEIEALSSRFDAVRSLTEYNWDEEP